MTVNEHTHTHTHAYATRSTIMWPQRVRRTRRGVKLCVSANRICLISYLCSIYMRHIAVAVAATDTTCHRRQRRVWPHVARAPVAAICVCVCVWCGEH